MNEPVQPSLSITPSAAQPTRRRKLQHEVLFWAPVWLPMVVLSQIALLGLGPAIARRRSLSAAESELAQRLEREEREQAELQRWQRAQSDAIYLERERRLLRTGEQPQTSK
jgi:hypothetical protein